MEEENRKHHIKTHKHIKIAQILVIIGMVINLVLFAAVYSILTGEINRVNEKVGGVSSDVSRLEAWSSKNFENLSKDLKGLESGINESTREINLLNNLVEGLANEIVRVGEESRRGIENLMAEVNTTGVVNKALEATVLIIWTDKSSVVGSGFIVSPDGYVLTADHVVDAFKGKTVRVKTKSGRMYIGEVIGRDESVDTAVLKISVRNATYLEFADSDRLRSGSKVFALGAPEGFGFSASEGIVSAVRSVQEIKNSVGLDLGFDPSTMVVQTDAAITHGNSGGPLIDTKGRVVGLNSFGVGTLSGGRYQDVEGLNFAIASNDIEGFYNSVAP